MGIIETHIPHHWNYFLALEDDVIRIARYLELTKDNFQAYSLELARLLSAAASEVDVVAKQLCKKLNKKSKSSSINAYMAEITNAYPMFSSAEVKIPKFGLEFHPWHEWTKQNVPHWWTAHNKVKHHRHTNFSDANLKHALNAVSGLFIFLLYFYSDEDGRVMLSPNPVLFRAGAPFTPDYPGWGAPNTMIYSLSGPIIVQNPVNLFS